ncbi:MAG: 3-isopropylmalate dehydratase small subunit [Candidatus Omnitrophica bacterium]|nr:3-isopropylmalate dehydratase small subunit [Candidatus Omnitrophota bacterium]
MQAFTHHRGVLALLDTANVDTDQIIAKQFLKSIKRTGFGEHLFHDWRYHADGRLNETFALNSKEFQGATVLVTRNNFGCGSSREHAVWAVQQYGFRAVIAPFKGEGDSRIPGFADIFRNNCSKNGLLTIEFSEKEVDSIFESVSARPGIEASIDLEKQTVEVHGSPALSLHFDISPAVKARLLSGLDDIGTTLQEVQAISDFEKRHNDQLSASPR